METRMELEGLTPAVNLYRPVAEERCDCPKIKSESASSIPLPATVFSFAISRAFLIVSLGSPVNAYVRPAARVAASAAIIVRVRHKFIQLRLIEKAIKISSTGNKMATKTRMPPRRRK